MKKKYSNLLGTCVLALTVGVTSCQDYLDKDPDSTVVLDDAYKTFDNFQGFIEEIYNCIPNKEQCYYTTSFNWGDDEIMNTEGDWHMCHQVDLGNFWAWQGGKLGQDGCWLDAARECNPNSNDIFQHRLWPHSWYCIRKCNLGLNNLDKLVDATDEERNLIEGQLYFFRAWWHFELMQFLGGLPYVDVVVDDTNEKLPRLSYRDCAMKAAADFRKAAQLLPINWDDTTVGKETYGKNDLRVNKIMALGYLGKNFLWAASPLMVHGAQLGAKSSGVTYDYDVEMCDSAANAFGELLNLVESGQTQYALVEFNYSDVYNHVKASGATTSYTDLFYTRGNAWKIPGSTEAIFRGRSGETNKSHYQFSKTWGPKINSLVPDDNIIHQPTANYVNLYGTNDGYPLDHENSKFDETHPFKDRDPRFYHDIVYDGCKYINNISSVEDADKPYIYSQLYTGGNVRNAQSGSRTGYFTQKLSPHTVNKYDLDHSWNAKLMMYLSYMRLADIYLMYAEACAAKGGATQASETYPGLTALDAIGRLRTRVGMPNVPDELQTPKETFMDEVRRERAVELAFEGFRFNDLQRWLLLTEYPYNQKTSQEFTRTQKDDWYESNKASEAQVDGWKEEVILTRSFSLRHYWFPMKLEDTYLYLELSQNPGW